MSSTKPAEAREDQQLSGQVSHRLRRVHQRASAIFAEFVGDPQLTPTQWCILGVLYENGPLSQNLLGRRSYMDPATTQGVIMRLMDRELVERRPDPDDRRRAIVSLTAAGLDFVERYTPAAVRANEAILAPLTFEERDTFLRLLSRLM